MPERTAEKIDPEEYLAFALRDTDPRVFAWSGRDRVRRILRDGLVHDIARRTDPEIAEQYQARCPVDGVEARDYMLREIDLGEDGRILAGIHFVSLQLSDPFAGIAYRTQPITTREARLRIGKRLQQEFASFAPKRWRVWEGALDTGLANVPEVETDQRLVAAHLAELRSRTALPLPSDADICSRPTAAEPIYDAYVAICERFFAEQPHMKSVIHVEPLEQLRDIADRGALYRVDRDGELAGIFAARPDREGPLDGWLMVEEILDTPWRGRGLAAPLQRRFVDALPAGADDILFGHIGGLNEPSLRTALRVGRVVIGRWSFVSFA